jgi:hypothetical protein
MPESLMKTLKVEGVYPMASEAQEDVAEQLPRFIGARMPKPQPVRRGERPDPGQNRSLITFRPKGPTPIAGQDCRPIDTRSEAVAVALREGLVDLQSTAGADHDQRGGAALRALVRIGTTATLYKRHEMNPEGHFGRRLSVSLLQHIPQVPFVEWLAQAREVPESRRQLLALVAGRQENRYAARYQDGGDLFARLAIESDVEHCAMDVLFLHRSERWF